MWPTCTVIIYLHCCDLTSFLRFFLAFFLQNFIENARGCLIKYVANMHFQSLVLYAKYYVFREHSHLMLDFKVGQALDQAAFDFTK